MVKSEGVLALLCLLMKELATVNLRILSSEPKRTMFWPMISNTAHQKSSENLSCWTNLSVIAQLLRSDKA
jgi:hypothetical protein